MKVRQKTIIIFSLILTALSCRNDPALQNPKIEKITFEESIKSIYVGDTVKINVSAEPREAKKYDRLAYRTSESGIIEIKAGSGNDGVVFEGIKRGNTVITASVNGVVDYCSVNVLGANENVIPHIIVQNYFMECRENERRSITASLAGGTPLDDSGFIWSYTNQKVISLESTGNIGVFDTKGIGSSVVTISHPKAQFSIDVLIYVIGNDEIPVYITTDNNVINIKKSESNYQYAVELRGGDSGDYYHFTHEIIDGREIVDLRVNNNIGTINPKAKGIARIGISHPKAAFRQEIVVIVREEVEYRYINVDKTLIIMEEGNSEVLTAEMTENVPLDYLGVYTFENENNNVINVQQSQDHFRINALQRGKSILKIKNQYADFDREVLVIVNGMASFQDNEVYITTNQNVITTEAGADNIILTMTLVGGNEADRNNFIWTVDDGSIISVESAHGTVNYRSRAAMSNAGEKFEAQAVITAKKAGTAKIMLENPKAKNSFSVMVKVYKKGVFGVVPVVIDGPSIYKVNIGEELPVNLRVVTGNGQNLTNISWKSENDNILSVSGSGLTGVLRGKENGITAITVSGDNVKHDYTATVIVGDNEYLETMSYMYVLNPFISVIKGGSVSFGIRCENMSNEDINGINVINNNGDIMEVLAYKNNVTVTGIALGEGEIIINRHGLNTLRVVVMVEDYDINPDMPFYLRAEKNIYGIVKGHNLEIGVDLMGGSEVNERGIIWKIEDSNVAMINGNGKRCVVTGRNSGQTVITVSHPKSHNTLVMVMYAVEHESELNSKVVMYVKEKNILLNAGETRYISIITNANDAQKNSLQWDISNANVIDVNVSGDRVKAYVAAKNAGNAVITVRSGNAMVPVVIYISVINKANGKEYINVPSILEMVAGETISINAVTDNIYDLMTIKWQVKDNDIAVVYGNGDTCLVNAIKSGSTVITAEYSPIGFVKDIILYVYNSAEDMAGRYLFAGEQSRFVINKGDIINVNLVFGMKGYPEYELHNIGWSTTDKTIIEVTGNGKTAGIRGINAGVGMVKVTDRYENEVKIEVEVRETGKAGQYWFGIRAEDRIKGILAGSSADIEIKVFNGNNEVFNINGIEYIVENTDIISVTPADGGIHIAAASGREGQSYITLWHDLVEEARILIYTAVSEYGLENAYPILAEKTNYLIKKGENITVMVQTKDSDNIKLNRIDYGLEKNNGVISISERNKREIAINANSVGSDVILVRYNAAVVQRIYVSVTDGNYGSNAGYMVTENIIGLLMGVEYETRVETDAHIITWKKQNDYVFDIVSTSGKSAVIKGYIPGKSLLTVSGGGIERNIAVFVCETIDELRVFQAINIEQRNYKVRKNENVTITIHSYQGRVEGETRYGDYYRYENPYGNVIEVNAVENNKLSVKCINEGVAAIRVTNSFYNTEIVVYIEVYSAGDGDYGFQDNKHIITTTKTLYVINKDEKNVYISVNVAGDNFDGDSHWIWSVDNKNIVNVSAMGKGAYINPLKEGQTIINVSNMKCANVLELTIIVGDRFVIDNSHLPYIYVEKDVYEVMKDAGNISIPYSIVNVEGLNAGNVRHEVYGNIFSVTHDAANGVFNVKVIDAGVARFEILYGDLRKEVYIIVKENIHFGNIFLTTNENYVVASIGELRTVNIQLAGYDEINNHNYIWSVEPKTGVIQLVGNGTAGQIYAVGTGDAVISITHNMAPYPLIINVKVVADKVKENVIYLTTQRNVIETVVGTANEQIYIQKIGGNMGNSQTTWTVSDSSIVSIISQGYTAQFTAKKEGVARIRAQNIESDYKLEIVIIVNKALNNNIYIDSATTLLMLSPGEAQRRIGVVLVNGEVKDNNKFKWSIDHQQLSDVNMASAPGVKVINIIGSNDECFINAVNEGIARIRVHNDKAERDLIITVYVTSYKEIKFSVNKKEIVIGENEFVGINLPSYEYLGNKVRVWVEQADGSSGSRICEVFYTNELVLLSGREKGVVIVKAAIEGKEGEAQLYVNVVENADPSQNRIITGKTLHILNQRSGPIILNASVGGPNIFDVDNDNIQWKINKTGVIDIMPKNDPSDTITGAKGKQVQITVKGLGTATILVKHNYVDEEYWKTISVIVSDTNNIFSVSRTNVTVNTLRPETVAAEIVGGTTRDYAEVKWIAKMQQKWDGTMLEIVRVMGSGREVTLYPMNEGQTEVLVIYGKETLVISVEVVSDYYFSFRNGNEFMYPGEIRDLPFDVRPANSTINWINTSPIGTDQLPVINYSEVLGSKPSGNGSAERYVQVQALREGTASITGMSNGKIAQTNIIVQYDYSFNTGRNVVHGQPKYNGWVNGRLVNENGVREIEYTVYPPDTYILPVASSINGLTIEIDAPVAQKVDGKEVIGGPGVGRIRFTGNRELIAYVNFKHYKPKKNNLEPPVETGNEKTIAVVYMFDDPVVVEPYFMRGDGVHSNKGQARYTLKNNSSPLNAERIKHKDGFFNEYELALGDGEEHYILFDSPYDTASVNITGINQENSNGTAYSIGDTRYSLDIVDLPVDGVIKKALRLSGGDDYIKYTRVAFDKKLYMYVQSNFYNNGNVTVSTQKQPIYDIAETVNYYYTDKYLFGPWEEYKQDTSGPVTSFYLLRNDDLAQMNMYERNLALNIYNPARIAKEPLLMDHAVNISYTYYYRDPSYVYNQNNNITNIIEYMAFINKYCDEYRTFPVIYVYDWEYYRDNRDIFDHSSYVIDKSALIYREDEETGELTDEIIGGSIATLLRLNEEYRELEMPQYITVYGYEKQKLLDLYEDGTLAVNLLSSWDKGGFDDRLIPYLEEYYDEYVYTTIIHNIDVVAYIPDGGDTVQSIYDVLGSTFVDGNYNPVTGGYNVYIDIPSPGSSYNKGAKTIRGNNNYEYVTYKNMRNSTVLNEMGKNREISHWAPITGTLQSYSYYYVTETFPYTFTPISRDNGVHNVHMPTIHATGSHIWCYSYPIKKLIYERYIYPYNNNDYKDYFRMYIKNKYTSVTNRAGKNIFGGSGDTVAYNSWSNYYYCGIAGGDNFQYYGETSARQMLRWEDRGRVIVPYYIFNRFPFRYEPDDGAHEKNIKNKYPAQQIVTIDNIEGGGIPMPSIDLSAKTHDIKVKVYYKVFDPQSSGGYSTKYFTLNITLEQRPSHMLYNNLAKINDNEINHVNTNTGWTEYAGNINTFSAENEQALADYQPFL
jgi:hypothetical protein